MKKPPLVFVTELYTTTVSLDGESVTRVKQWECRLRKVLKTMIKTGHAPRFVIDGLEDHGQGSYTSRDGDQVTLRIREFLAESD